MSDKIERPLSDYTFDELQTELAREMTSPEAFRDRISRLSVEIERRLMGEATEPHAIKGLRADMIIVDDPMTPEESADALVKAAQTNVARETAGDPGPQIKLTADALRDSGLIDDVEHAKLTAPLAEDEL